MAEPEADLSAEAPAGGDTPAAEQPEWFQADKYESVEAQAKAYTEAETRMRRAQSELDRERAQHEQEMQELTQMLQQEPAQQQYTDPSLNPLMLAMQQARDEGDIVKEEAYRQQLIDAQIQQRLAAQQKPAADNRRLDSYEIGQMHKSIASEYGADEKIQARALELMENHPVVS